MVFFELIWNGIDMKSAMISQSNYIPWKGYFDSIAMVDVFVVYDDMQYTKRDWRNRNLIKTPNGLKWISIPIEVKGKFNQKINEAIISDRNWNKEHLNYLKQNYKKSLYYNEVIDWVEYIYMNCTYKFLSEINLYFIKNFMNYLDIQTQIIDSRNICLTGDKTEKLINICKDIGVNKYFTGSAAKEYLDESLFSNNNIEVNYFEYSGYKEYPQLYGDFNHNVSILDLIFNCGNNSKNFVKSIQ